MAPTQLIGKTVTYTEKTTGMVYKGTMSIYDAPNEPDKWRIIFTTGSGPLVGLDRLEGKLLPYNAHEHIREEGGDLFLDL
jgi:hypothetical protein